MVLPPGRYSVLEVDWAPKGKKKLSKSLKSKWKEIVDEKYEKGMELVMNPVKIGGLFTIWLTENSAFLTIFLGMLLFREFVQYLLYRQCYQLVVSIYV